MRLLSVALFAAFLAASLCPAYAETYQEAMRRLAESDLRAWASQPTIVDAVRVQNRQNQGMDGERIAALDRRWRAEMASPSRPMVQALMANVLSSFLNLKKRRSNGLITEIIVMDRFGLNAGLSDASSDYWQGDEDKWRRTFLVGPDAMYIGTIERDQSTRRLQGQLSLPVVDPVTGKPIGAVTIGVDVSKLFKQ